MKNYRIAYYSNKSGSREFVVILSPDSDPADYLEDGITMDDIADIAGDVSVWPCDRVMEKE